MAIKEVRSMTYIKNYTVLRITVSDLPVSMSSLHTIKITEPRTKIRGSTTIDLISRDQIVLVVFFGAQTPEAALEQRPSSINLAMK